MRGPYAPYDKDDKRRQNPYSPFGTPSDWFPVSDPVTDEIMKEMKRILKSLLNDSNSKKKMKDMKKRTTLKATVKRGEKKYRITIEEITPKPSEVPDEIKIEWDSDKSFGKGHKDLKE